MRHIKWAVLFCTLMTVALATTAFAAEGAGDPARSAVPGTMRAAAEERGVYIWNNAGINGTFAVVLRGLDNVATEDAEVLVWPLGHFTDAHTYTPQQSGSMLVAEVNIRNHSNRVGTYCVGAFVHNADGGRDIIGTARTLMPPQAGTLEAAPTDGEQNGFAFNLKDARLPEGSAVVIAVSRDGKEVALKIAHKAKDGYAASVRTSELGQPGVYNVQAYCTAASASQPLPVGDTSFAVEGLDDPVSEVALDDSAQGAFRIETKVHSASPVQLAEAEVRCDATNTMRTYSMQHTGGAWRACGNLDDFSHVSGAYTVRVHMELANGVHAVAADIHTELRPANYMWLEKDSRGGIIHVDNADPALQSVTLPMWSTTNGQDDLVVYEAERTADNAWQARVDFSRHKAAGKFACSLSSGEENLGTLFFGVTETEIWPQEPMRGVWVPSVWNLDFPRKTNDVAAQMNEFRRIVQNSKDWGFNALFVQVRPWADALYRSEINPWSMTLTGSWGRDPGYDPLEIMIQTAHDAGLELHAWLNPYRVCETSRLNQLAPSSVAAQHPDWLIRHEGIVYLDPSQPGVRQHLRDTVHEIIENYDVDGIHFDDYFYPYNYPLPAGEQRNGAVAEARRENVNTMVRMISEEVRSAPRHISFGISPFGIWKNASSDPAGSGTSGLESYYSNYCDTVQWVNEGLLDYVCPQLYWQTGHRKADYATLVDWWSSVVEGTGTDLYIGQGISEKAVAAEIESQLSRNTQYDNIGGSIFYRYGDIEKNPDLAQRIRSWYQNNG